MKKFTRIKEKGSRQYAYEITPYYDPETKNTKQKSKYLGVYKDGEIKRVRTKMPIGAFDYGEFVPLIRIIEELGIEDKLGSILAERQVYTILTLALNRVIHPVSACNIRTWYERTYLSKVFGDIPISSQSLSEFMGAIGESTVPMDFSEQLINTVGAGDPLLYDITSLSSSSKLMDILEWGHNKDGDGLPQLNLSIIANKDLGIPLSFDVYPGSIVDVSTLKNTTKKMKSFGVKNPTMILDRGFFSETNLNDLIDYKASFVIPGSYANNKIKSIVATSREHIENPKYLKKFSGNVIFVKPSKLKMKRRSVDAYVFYDLAREKDDKTKFYNRLHDVEERLKKRKLRPYEKAGMVFHDIANDFSKYFTFRVKDGRFVDVKMKPKTIARRVNRMGFTVILYNGKFRWDEVMTWTKERDVIEKMFLQLKSDLNAKPMRAHKTEVAKGWIFVGFIALILRCRLSKLMIEKDLIKKYSIPSLMLTLSRLKQIELSDGSLMLTEVTKKQRDIYEAFGIEP